MASFDMILSNKQITKPLISLRGCAGWSAPLLFANPRRQVFSRRGPSHWCFIFNIHLWSMNRSEHVSLLFWLVTLHVKYSDLKVYVRMSVCHLYTCMHLTMYSQCLEGAQWLSGRVLDSRPKGRGFEPHRRHCVVLLEQDTFILA